MNSSQSIFGRAFADGIAITLTNKRAYIGFKERGQSRREARPDAQQRARRAELNGSIRSDPELGLETCALTFRRAAPIIRPWRDH